MNETIDRSDKFNWDLEDIEIQEPERKPEKAVKARSARPKQKQSVTENARPTT